MLPDAPTELDSISYKFQDLNEFIILNLYVNGAFEQKAIEVFSETDSLEVISPSIF